jgi:4-hydroxybenzoate polyprenyltransferase
MLSETWGFCSLFIWPIYVSLLVAFDLACLSYEYNYMYDFILAVLGFALTRQTLYHLSHISNPSMISF